MARGPVSLGTLARAEQVSPATMSRIVRGLEARGLVTRRPDPKDRRAVVLRPTLRGRRAFRLARDARLAALTERLSHLAPGEISLLERAAVLLERVATGA